MNLFEMMCFHMVFIFFPILLYLIYVVYNKNMERKENDLFFEFALLSSLYLIIKYGVDTDIPILLVNLPLIIAYIKKRDFGILLVSVGLIYYYSSLFSYSIFVLILEYLLYYVVYILFFKKKMDDYYFILVFSFLKLIMFTLFLWMEEYFVGIVLTDILGYFILSLTFLVFTFLSIFLLKKGEDILGLYMTVKELEKEKDVLHSLFQITHEIKNPIAVCKGYLDMFDVHNMEHSRKYIPILKEEIERTLLLLQDFLSINKIKIENDILDVQFLMEETVRSLQPLLREKNVDLVVDFLDDEFYMMGDYNRLKQVLVNVFKNAIEAMECVLDKRLVVCTSVNDNVFRIEIEDNGEGISKENLEKLKQPFFTTKVKGTGLGVYLSDSIIKAHGGLLEYDSVVGKGTKVSIVLNLLEE